MKAWDVSVRLLACKIYGRLNGLWAKPAFLTQLAICFFKLRFF